MTVSFCASKENNKGLDQASPNMMDCQSMFNSVKLPLNTLSLRKNLVDSETSMSPRATRVAKS